MTDREKVNEYLSYLSTVQGYSEKTVISYGHDLERLLVFLEKHKLTIEDFVFEDAREFTSGLYEEGLNGSTINRILSANRSFFKNLNETDYTKNQPFERISRARQGQRIPTVLSEEELKALLFYNWEDYTELTEITMFNLFYSTGCRLSEILEMKLNEIDLENRRIIVTGKGTKQRYVFLSHRAVQMLEIYIPERKNVFDKPGLNDNGILFINKKGKPLPISTVHSIFDKYRVKLGLTKKFTPHVLRHTFATNMLDSNSDIRIVQALLGHENIGTTQIYTHVTSAKLENVYRNAHPHGRKK